MGSGFKIEKYEPEVGLLPKITLGITGLHEIWGRDYGIEESF